MSGNNDGHNDDDGDDNKVADEYYDISELHLDRTDALLDAADPLHSCHGPTIASQHRNQTLGLKYKHSFFFQTEKYSTQYCGLQTYRVDSSDLLHPSCWIGNLRELKKDCKVTIMIVRL